LGSGAPGRIRTGRRAGGDLARWAPVIEAANIKIN